MKKLFAAGIAVGLAVGAAAAEQVEFTTNSIPIQGHGALEIKAPKAWRVATTNAFGPAGPHTVVVQSAAGDIAVQITIYPEGLGTNQLKPDDEKMAELLKTFAEAQYAPAAVEKQVTMEKLKGADVSGSFARFSDAKWVGKKPPPAEFSNVATGLMRCGDLWGNFTVLTNDKDGPLFKEGLAVVESLRKTKP
jgi:hypothetical protein